MLPGQQTQPGPGETRPPHAPITDPGGPRDTYWWSCCASFGDRLGGAGSCHSGPRVSRAFPGRRRWELPARQAPSFSHRVSANRQLCPGHCGADSERGSIVCHLHTSQAPQGRELEALPSTDTGSRTRNPEERGCVDVALTQEVGRDCGTITCQGLCGGCGLNKDADHGETPF